jgi:hypothetical protein
MARELWVKKASVPLLAEVELCDLDGPEESIVCGVGGCKAVLRSSAGLPCTGLILSGGVGGSGRMRCEGWITHGEAGHMPSNRTRIVVRPDRLLLLPWRATHPTSQRMRSTTQPRT